jgi:hypothetical protein
MGWREDFITRVRKARDHALKLGTIKYPTQHTSFTSSGTGGKGDRGLTGPQGPRGYTGPRGLTGSSLKGSDGKTGATGTIGKQGPTGPAGRDGDRGPTGSNGLRGSTGIQGPKGPTGPISTTKGPTGSRGPTGAKGSTGSIGTSGAPGVKGPTGPNGLKGATGTNGLRGPTGANGSNGSKGATGSKGSTGPAGNTTWKTGIVTKNINDASTTQVFAHGLGRVPNTVKLTGHAVAGALSQITYGCFDGTNHSGISICMTEGTTTATTDTIYSSTSAEIGFTAAGSTSPFNGANRQTGVVSVDATNITITWTKAGTVNSNTVNILWEVN